MSCRSLVRGYQKKLIAYPDDGRIIAEIAANKSARWNWERAAAFLLMASSPSPQKRSFAFKQQEKASPFI